MVDYVSIRYITTHTTKFIQSLNRLVTRRRHANHTN